MPNEINPEFWHQSVCGKVNTLILEDRSIRTEIK
jgi:hypothetical protein